MTGCGPLEIQRKAEAGAPGNSRARRRQHNDQSRAASVSCNALTNRPRGASFSAKRGRACPRAKTRGWPKAGWGAEGRHGPMKVRNDGRCNPTRAEAADHTPSGASRHLPQQVGKGSPSASRNAPTNRPRAPPSPRSGEGGRRPDGVRKAGMRPTKVRDDGRAIQLGPKQRTTPHPALRATFPQAGEGGERGPAEGWWRGRLPRHGDSIEKQRAPGERLPPASGAGRLTLQPVLREPPRCN